MALPSSGPLSLAAIAAEFGGSAPHSINEYYRGGGLVPNTSTNNSIPTSGQISFSNFYGTAAGSPIAYVTAATASSGNTNTLVLQIPSTVIPGDLLLCVSYRRAANTPLTVPVGYTELYSATGNNNALTTFYKFATAADPNVTLTLNPSQAALCVVYRNIGPAPNFRASGIGTSASAGPPAWPNVTFATVSQTQRAVFYAVGLKGGMLGSDWRNYPPVMTANSLPAHFKAGVWNFQYSSGTGSSAVAYDTTPDSNFPSGITIPDNSGIGAVVSPPYMEFFEWLTQSITMRGTY